MAGAEGDAVDVRWTDFPGDLADAYHREANLQVSAGELLLTISGIARFRLRGGAQIDVAPFPGVRDEEVRPYLLGTMFGLLCLRRGTPALHANLIVMRGQTIAFAGESGIGKSTLAAHFAARGHLALSDDACKVDFSSAGLPMVWAGVPRIRLARDSIVALGNEAEYAELQCGPIEKFLWSQRPRPPRGGLPLRSIYVLSRSERPGPPEISRLKGHDAVDAVMRQTFRRELLGRIRVTDEPFKRIIAVLRHVPVYAVSWCHDFSALAANADRLEAHALGDDVRPSGR